MAQPLCVLVVEDSEDDVTFLLRELRKGGYEPNYLVVCTPQDMRRALIEVEWDIIISDWSMPQFNGLEAFRIARERGLDVPFIIVSGTIGEEIAVEALKAGVQDFMTKGMFARLVPAIKRELRELQERRRRREAEREVEHRRNEIAESERLLRLVIESVPDGVVVVDAQREFVLWNRSAEILVDMQAAQATAVDGARYGLFLPDRVTPHPPAEQLLDRALHGEQIDRHEVFVRHPRIPDGAFLGVNARALRDASGAVRGAVGVFRDLTREKAAQEQLMISDRMASIGMLAAGVAHEINNPLAAVMANLELAQRELLKDDSERLPGDSQELTEMLADAHTAAGRVRQIVRDLKIFARHEESRGGAVEIHRVLESSIRMAWNEIRHRAHLVKDFGPNALVQGTESRLGQVFLNLIVNAAQAIPEGRVEGNTIRIATRSDEHGRVQIDISDTGSGIAPNALRQLFTPFFTTKPVGVGTGLGLAICHRIITGFGGEIQVESEVGKGTTFRVVLPPAQSSEIVAPQAATEAANAKRRGRVLVIDDEPLMGPAIRRILFSEHDVVLTNGAIEALQRLKGGERYDVILCDLMMPQMTGMELHAEMQRLLPEQARRMIFLTGGAFTPSARNFLDEVPNERLEKPFDREQLRALVNARIPRADLTH